MYIKIDTDDKKKQSCTDSICQVTAGGVGGVMFLIIIVQFVTILHLCTQRRLVEHCIYSLFSEDADKDITLFMYELFSNQTDQLAENVVMGW